MKVASDGEVGNGACRGAPPRLLMHDRTVWAGRAFRFGGMMDEATAHLDAHGNAATAATAAAAAAGYGGRGHSDAAARVWLVCRDRAHGHVAEPVVDVFAPQLDLSAPRPPADQRQAAQQPNNRREHADDEDGDGVAIGAVQRARRPLRGRRGQWRGWRWSSRTLSAVGAIGAQSAARELRPRPAIITEAVVRIRVVVVAVERSVVRAVTVRARVHAWRVRGRWRWRQ